jgi:hypothetical protein
MPITLLDGIVIGFTLVSALLAMVRGFSREVLSIVSWVAAAAAAFYFHPILLPYVTPYVDHPMVSLAVAAAVIFFIALIVVTVITMKIADFIIDSKVGALGPHAGLHLRRGARAAGAGGGAAVLQLAGGHQPACLGDGGEVAPHAGEHRRMAAGRAARRSGELDPQPPAGR